jgi:hypothetical protein
METLSETETQLCPHCQQRVQASDGICNICRRIIFPEEEYPSGGQSRQKGGFVRLSMYATAIVAFGLGIMEGFMDNNSAAMTINLLISLILLTVSPRSNQSPFSVLAFAIAINVANQLVSPLYDIFTLEKFLWIKVLLVLIPATGMVVLLTMRRFPFESGQDR